MMLGQITTGHEVRPALSVPGWMLGTVRRRSITFADGFEDPETFVVWVQAHAMTGDIRIHPKRPHLSPDDRLRDLNLETLALLASVEGGFATARWHDGVMSWHGWTGFQSYDKYPEPGLLRRIGSCLIETAPSGIYVEDWRFQSSAPGILASLSLISETDHHGTAQPRNGGLIIAGDHAIRVIARREPLPEGTRSQDFVRNSPNPVAALEQVLDCTVDYARREGRSFVIRASTDPRREGQSLDLLSRFMPGPIDGQLIELVDGDAVRRSWLWRIESLELQRAFPLATDVAAERLAWLERERDTLKDPIPAPPLRSRPQCAS